MSSDYAPDGSPWIPALNGTLIPGSQCTINICSLDYAQMDYVPSLAANLAYLIIFGILLLTQLGVSVAFRTWSFMVGTCCGSILEIVGYGGRVGLHYDPFSFDMFLVYLICLTIAPAFLSASVYLCLSRLITIHGTRYARFRPRTYTIVFICCDLISLILQAVGGALAAVASTKPEESLGINVMIAGLAYQVFSLLLFMVLCLDYVLRVKKRGSEMNREVRKITGFRKLVIKLFPFGKFLLGSLHGHLTNDATALATATVLIFVRSVYRVVELQGGFASSLANNQTLFLIFEGPMIILALLSLSVCHPAFALPSVPVVVKSGNNDMVAAEGPEREWDGLEISNVGQVGIHTKK